jgi:RNA-binding protein YlmH
LGISRDRVGDIMINEDSCYVAVSDSIKDFIIENLTSISHQPITITLSDEIVVLEDKGVLKTIFIASNRLDAIISAAYNISREESANLILKELVKVNQKIVTKSFQNVNPCDIISVAHKGRVKILDTSGVSRSGRIILQIKIYR